MPRPHRCRRVDSDPDVTYFKPAGVPMRTLEEVRLQVDGFEALRLSDVEGLSQESAASRMGVSQPTFCRILASARKSVATALVNGSALRIQGGVVAVKRS